MSAAMSSPGAPLAGPALPVGVLATVAFPLGDLAALRELVEHYARLIGARAATLDQPLTLSGDDLLADPALACWASQQILASTSARPLPNEPPRSTDAAPAVARAPGSWPDCLAPAPVELCGALRPPDRPQGGPRHPPAVLRTELNAAMVLLCEVWPEASAEVTLLVRAVLDGVAPAGRQTSGSSASCPFVIAIDFEAGAWPGFLADALVHETSHMKLRLVTSLDPVVHDGGEASYHHPWRPEERPIEAVLVACHAFVAVHRFHVSCARVRGDQRARAQCRQLGPELQSALAELRRGWASLTPTGRHIADLLLREQERTASDARDLGIDE
jgi:hypothetical protein